MSLSASQSKLGSVISVEQLARFRAPATPPPQWKSALRGAATITESRLRTELLVRILDEAESDAQFVELVLQIWTAARADDRAGLRLLSSLLEVRLSGLELLRDMLRPTQAVRACALWKRPDAPWPVAESIVIKAGVLAGRVGIEPDDLWKRPVAAIERLHEHALQTLEQILLDSARSLDVAWLRELAVLEMNAQELRLEILAERVGAYDGRRISRVLPILSRREERIRDTQAILMRWPDTQELRRRTPVLVQSLEPKGYDKLLKLLDAAPGGRQLAYTLKLLRACTPLSDELAFGAVVLRELDATLRSGRGPRLDASRCVLLAMQLGRHSGRFSVQLGSSNRERCRGLAEHLRLTLDGEMLQVEYDATRHRRLLAPDGTPELASHADQQPTNVRDLVLANIGNEHILCGLLKQPRVMSSAGLVEIVVNRSRSIKVLLEIANRRDLYTGYANRNVPLALLKHPASIPISALRKFVHVKFVGRRELQSFAGRGVRVRPEIRRLAASYLESL